MRNARPVQTFSAIVGKVDVNPYVAVPTQVVRQLREQAGKRSGPIPVTGKLQGKPFKATVVKFRGVWRLYLNTAMRERSGIDVGDRAAVTVRVDHVPRTVPVPKAFALAIAKSKRAKSAFDALAPYRQREILRYLNGLKAEETLTRNIKKTIQFLSGKKVSGLVAVTSRGR